MINAVRIQVKGDTGDREQLTGEGGKGKGGGNGELAPVDARAGGSIEYEYICTCTYVRRYDTHGG